MCSAPLSNRILEVLASLKNNGTLVYFFCFADLWSILLLDLEVLIVYIFPIEFVYTLTFYVKCIIYMQRV